MVHSRGLTPTAADPKKKLQSTSAGGSSGIRAKGVRCSGSSAEASRISFWGRDEKSWNPRNQILGSNDAAEFEFWDRKSSRTDLGVRPRERNCSPGNVEGVQRGPRSKCMDYSTELLESSRGTLVPLVPLGPPAPKPPVLCSKLPFSTVSFRTFPKASPDAGPGGRRIRES